MEHNELPRMPTSERVVFDAESRDVVRDALKSLLQEFAVIIDSSLLREGTKQEMRDFLLKFITEFEDDGIVERGWVTFDSGGNIIRARSEKGVYDLQNTLRYLLEEMHGRFFNPLAVSLINESQKEMREVKNVVQSAINVMV